MKLSMYNSIHDIDDHVIKSVVSLLENICNDLPSNKVVTKVKQNNDFVTNLDTYIDDRLKTELPIIYNAAYVSEESNNYDTLPKTCWIVDPLDGTVNYMHGFPSYGISVALMIDGAVSYGFVLNLVSLVLYIAKLGDGAIVSSMSSKTIKSICPSSTATLSDSMLCVGVPYDKSKLGLLLSVMSTLLPKCQDIKRCGSAALDICRVAAGIYDGYLERDIHPWDYAAAALILTEAGGVFTDWTGDKVSYDCSGDFVASNPNLFPSLIKEIMGACEKFLRGFS